MYSNLWLAWCMSSTSWQIVYRSSLSSMDDRLLKWIVGQLMIVDNLYSWNIHGEMACFYRWHRLEILPVNSWGNKIFCWFVLYIGWLTYLNTFCTLGCKVVLVAWYAKDFVILWYEALASDRSVTWRAEEAVFMELLSFVLHFFHSFFHY